MTRWSKAEALAKLEPMAMHVEPLRAKLQAFLAR
jgi:hypothetical protein